MNEESKLKDMVECHYQGTISYIPVQLYSSMTMRAQYIEAKYIRFKDVPKMYGISISTVKRIMMGRMSFSILWGKTA